MFKEFTKELNGKEISFRIKEMNVSMQMAFVEKYGTLYFGDKTSLEELANLKDRMLEFIEYKSIDSWEQVKAPGEGNYQLPNLNAKLGRELEMEFIDQVIKPVF